MVTDPIPKDLAALLAALRLLGTELASIHAEYQEAATLAVDCLEGWRAACGPQPSEAWKAAAARLLAHLERGPATGTLPPTP
jgi:hypothetical protein